jgi:hypothetical protein
MSEVIQPMPELTSEEFDALRADIAAHGVLVPIVRDQHGRIIDGNHRAAIAQELGIDCAATVIEVADDDDALDRAVSLNCARRHLTREQRRDLIEAEIRRRPDDSDRAIARRVGCSPSTVGTVRAHLRIWAEEITEQIRQEIRNEMGRLTAGALLEHVKGIGWQVVGDTLERHYRNGLSLCADDDGNPASESEAWEPLWRHVWGPFFDGIRATDCAEIREQPCTVCTDADREWRDNHPERVYRWSDGPMVSNLDTPTGAVR